VITEHDLQEAIAECEGQRNPSASTCLKLAAFYTIRDKMYPIKQEENIHMENEPYYSYARSENDIEAKSEFRQVIQGIDAEEFLVIMDELMDTIKTLMPKLYDGVIRRLSQ